MLLETNVIGNIGNDAKIQEVNGKHAVNFSIAYNECYTDADAVVHEKTTWINCTLWSEKKGELVKYLKKGQLVYVSGAPDPRIYRNNAGEPMIDFKLNVTKVRLLGRAKKDDAPQQADQSQKQPVQSQQTANAADVEDDLPF